MFSMGICLGMEFHIHWLHAVSFVSAFSFSKALHLSRIALSVLYHSKI